MTRSPRKEKKAKPHRLLFAIMILMLFVTAALPVRVAVAADVVTCPTCDATNTLDFTALTTAVGGFFTALQTYEGQLQTWLQENGFSGIISATIGSTSIQTNGILQMLSMHSDAQAQDRHYAILLADTARAQARATLSNQSTACAVTGYEAARQQLGMRDIAGPAAAMINAQNCTGNQSDCSGSQQKREFVQNLCDLGFIPVNQYGSGWTCPKPKAPLYGNITGNIAYLLNQPELQFATSCVKPDGFRSFDPNDTNCIKGTTVSTAFQNYNNDPAQSQLLYAAFYLLCETLSPTNSSPPFADYAPNDEFYNAVYRHQMSLTASSSGIQDQCFKALFERTAYPSGSDQACIQQGGTSATCHDAQVATCLYLRTPAPYGMGYATDDLATDCEHKGLSLVAQNRILSHCADVNRMGNTVANQTGDAAALDAHANTCFQQGQAFDAKLGIDDNALIAAIANSIQARATNLTGDNATAARSK